MTGDSHLPATQLTVPVTDRPTERSDQSAIHQRLTLDVMRYPGSVDLRVVPPLCPISVSPTDFSQADDLIRRAHRHTRTWLERGDDGSSVRARVWIS